MWPRPHPGASKVEAETVGLPGVAKRSLTVTAVAAEAAIDREPPGILRGKTYPTAAPETLRRAVASKLSVVATVRKENRNAARVITTELSARHVTAEEEVLDETVVGIVPTIGARPVTGRAGKTYAGS